MLSVSAPLQEQPFCDWVLLFEELPLVQLDTVLDKPGAASDQPAIGGSEVADNLDGIITDFETLDAYADKERKILLNFLDFKT